MRVSATIAAVLAALTLGALAAAAQGVPWRLVQSGDGALHVIADGVRHRIAPAPISDGELAGVAEGESWDSTFAPVVTVAAPPPAAPPPEPPTTVPRTPRVGDTAIMTTPAGLRLAVTVLDVRDPVQSTNRFSQPSGRFVVLDWEVKNEGNADYRVSAADLKIQTIDGFVVERTFAAGLPEPTLDSDVIGPGQRARGYLHYDVPTGQRLKSAIFHPSGQRQFVVAELAQ